MFIELRNFSYSPRGSISAPGADIMPKWYYIHPPPSADINELCESGAPNFFLSLFLSGVLPASM